MDSNDYIEQINQRIEDCNKAIFQIDPLMLQVDDFETIMRSLDDIDSMSMDQLETMSIKITQHCYYAQARLNRVKALIDYLDSLIKNAVAEDIRQYKGVSWDYAEMLAIKNNTFAIDIHNKVREYKTIFTSCRNQVEILRELSKKIEGLKYRRKA